MPRVMGYFTLFINAKTKGYIYVSKCMTKCCKYQ